MRPSPRAWTLVAAVSGVLLAPLAFLAIVTGYCMLSPESIGVATLGLLEEYAVCSFLHIEIIPPALAVAGGIHAISAVEILAYRLHGAGRAYSRAFEAFRLGVWVLSAQAIAIAAVFAIT